jgi:hypothetical protein
MPIAEVAAFAPYAEYRETDNANQEFVELTEIAYGLSQQLLFEYPKGTVRPGIPEMTTSELKRMSYCEADVSVDDGDVIEVCRWVTLEECAALTGIDRQAIGAQAEAGELGPVETHPVSGEPVVIWPPEERARGELPPPMRKTYRVTAKISAVISDSEELEDVDEVEAARQRYLGLAHSLGEPSQVAERASAVLYRVGLLLQWTAFEVFLRQVTEILIRRHPAVLGKGSRGKQTLTLADLIAGSEALTSIDALSESIIESQIAALRGGGRSVHGLLNFLKSEFQFENDPYDAWLVWKGTRQAVTFGGLVDLKNLRNQLVHEGSTPVGLDREAVVDSDAYYRGRLMLRAVAHSVSRSIVEGRYTPS